MGSGSLLRVLARNFDVLAGPLVAFVYPLYASVKAIESKSPVDDQQWLTYWVLHSLLTLFELTFGSIIEWVPIWTYAKLMFNCWLVLPYFNGASYVYEHFVRPMVMNQQTVKIWYVPRKKGIFSKPDDVLLAAEKFLEENGPDAFQKLLNKAKNASKTTKNDKHVTFDLDENKKESKSWKNLRRVRFSKGDADKKTKPSHGDRFVTVDEVKVERESRTPANKVDAEREPKLTSNPSNSGPATYDAIDVQSESNTWMNSSFMFFDDDRRYWS